MNAGAEGFVAELGPLLGRVIAPPEAKTPVDAALEQVRLELLTGLFERRSALDGPTWLSLWESAVERAAGVLHAEIERQLLAAAAVSRYPAKRLPVVLPDGEELRILKARLAAAGSGLEEAVERLEPGAPASPEALRRAAGELVAAWERLLSTAHTELRRWQQRATAIESWRRSWWPVLLIGAALLMLASWLGLVLGGYLPSPRWLAPFANWIWNL